MLTKKSTYKHNTIKYSAYVNLIAYLADNCTDKEYHKAMIKLDNFKIIVKD